MTAETNTPLQFRQIQDIHERFKSVNPAFERMSLPEFSTYMEQQTQQPLFEAGKNDNFLMRASAGIDRALEATGLPQASETLGRGVGSVVGMEQEMGDLFRSFPRMTATIAPMMLTAPFSLPVAGAGLVTSAALGGLEAYEKSGGNAAAGLIGAAAVPATLGAARLAGQQALTRMGAPVIEDLFQTVSYRTPATTGQKLAQYGAENLGAMAVGELAGQAQSLAMGQGLYNPLDPKNLALMVAGNIPFAAFDLQQLRQPLAARPERPMTSGEAAKVMQQVEAARIQAGVENPVRATEDGRFVIRDGGGRVMGLTEDVDEAAKVQQFADDLPAANPADPLRLVRRQGYMDRNFVKQFFADETDPTGANREAARSFALEEVQRTLDRGGRVFYEVENGPRIPIASVRDNLMISENGKSIVGLGLYSDAEAGRLVFERPQAEGANIQLSLPTRSTTGEIIPASEDVPLVYRIGELFRPQENGTVMLGNRYTLDQNQRIGAVQFEKAMEVGGVPKYEIDLYKALVPEAFTEAGQVNVGELIKGLKNNPPIVEFVDNTSEQLKPGERSFQQRMGEIQHELENSGYRYEADMDGTGDILHIADDEFVDYAELPPEIRRYADEINILLEGREQLTTRDYRKIAPKEDMPGYVEGLIRVPGSKGNFYNGPHFGIRDKNVLAFFRGYEETLPSGEKALHVFEVQSDWNTEFERSKGMLAPFRLDPALNPLFPTRTTPLEADANQYRQGMAFDKSLVPRYEQLALQAAIAHAKKIGATKLIIADSVTAMRAEGHYSAGYIEPKFSGPTAKTPFEVRVSRFNSNPQTGYFSLYAGDLPNNLEIVGISKESPIRQNLAEMEFVSGIPRINVITSETKTRDRQAASVVLPYFDPKIHSEIFLRDKVSNQLYSIESVDAPDLGYLSGTKMAPLSIRPIRGFGPRSEEGMQLHYDVTLPATAERLLGNKGVRTVIGPGKYDQGYSSFLGEDTKALPTVSSPAFGTFNVLPQPQMVGRVFDLNTKKPSLYLSMANLVDEAMKIRQARDAQEALLQYQDTLAQATGSAQATEGYGTNLATVKEIVRPFLNDWEQKQIGLNRVTPQEAVARAINVMATKIDKMAAQQAKNLEDIPTTAQARGLQELGEVTRVAMERLPIEYKQRAAEFIKRFAFEPLEEGPAPRKAKNVARSGEVKVDEKVIEAEVNKLRNLASRETDPDLKAALDQEIEYYNQPKDDKYNRELAALLEDYPAYIEVTSAGGSMRAPRAGREFADATDIVYQEVLRQYEEGVPANQVKLSPGIVISKYVSLVRRGQQPPDLMPSMKMNAAGEWELAELTSRAEADAFIAKLNETKEPYVWYKAIMQQTKGDNPRTYFQVRRFENLMQRFVEGYDPDTNNIFAAKRRGDLEGDIDFDEFYQNYSGNNDDAPVKQGIKGGQQFLADSLHARGMFLADKMTDTFFDPRHRENAVERLKILLELERNETIFRVDKNGKLIDKSVNVKLIQQAWKEAGGLEVISADPDSISKLVRRKVSALLEPFQKVATRDPIMLRLNKSLREYARWASESGRGETPELFAARQVIIEAASKLRELHKNVGMRVVQSVGDLAKNEPEVYRALMEQGPQAEAFFNPKKQEITIIADNVVPRANEVTLADSMARLIWHEGAGHYGMQKLLGNEYNAIMRGILRKIPDAERDSIMAMYRLTKADDIRIAEEYVAQKSESEPKLPLLQELAASLRSYARAFSRIGPFGRDPKDLGDTAYRMTDADIIYAVKRSRDFMRKRDGWVLPGTVPEDESRTMGEEPDGMDYKSDTYFSLPAGKIPGSGLPDAYNFVAARGLERGLSPEESNRHAENVVSVLQKRPDITAFQKAGKGLTTITELGRMYFKENRQLAEIRVRAQEGLYLHSAFARAMDSAPDFSPVKQAVNNYDKWVSSLRVEDLESLRAGLSAIDPDLIAPEGGINARALAAFVADAYVSKDVYALRELMQAAPAPVGNLVKALFKDATAMAESGLSLWQAEGLAMTQKRGVGAIQRKALERVYDAMLELRADDVATAKAQDQFMKLENFQPERILDAIAGGNDMAGPLKTISDNIQLSMPRTAQQAPKTTYRDVPEVEPKAPGALSRMFNLPSNIAEDYPEFLPFLRTATAYTALSQQAVSEAFMPFGLEIQAGKMVKTENYERFKKTVRSPSMRKAISELMLRQNEKLEKLTQEDLAAEAAGQPPSMKPGDGRLTADEIRVLRETSTGSLRTLSDNDYQSVVAVFEKMTDSASNMSEVIIRSQAANIANTLRTELAMQKGWTGLEEIDRATNLAVKYLQDRNAANEWQKNTWKVVEPSDFLAMLAKIDDVYRVPFETFAGYLRKRDGYLPEFRLGQYTISYKDATTGEKKTIGAMDLKDVYAKRDELYAQGAAVPGSVQYQSKKTSRLENSLLSKGALERAREIEKLAMTQLKNVLDEETYEAVVNNYEPVTASIDAETQKTMQDYLRRRTLAGGREDLDAVDVLMSYIPAVAYGTARSNVRQSSAFYLKDARIADNEVLRELAATHINNALRASGGGEKAIREAAFQYFMALNPSTMVMELLQTTSTLVPFLTRQGAGFFGSYAELKKAMGQVTQAGRNGKYADAELESMVNRAADEAIISRGLYQELDDPSGGLTEVQDAVLGVEHAARRFGKAYINTTRNLYGMTAHFNSRVAFVAGFNRGKKLGLKGEDLYEFARRTTQTTMFTGGKGNRAIGLNAGDPGSQPIRAMIGSLQSYFQGMVGTIARYARESVARDLPPAERAKARKAFLQIMGTQLFYAGAMGLPGVAAAVALMEQMFPELELKKNIEEVPKRVLGDTQFGGWMVDSMLYGVPTSSSPIDVSARLGLGQVLGVSSLTGFDTTALFGPFGSIVSNVAGATQELQEGDLMAAGEKLSPVFMKNILKAVKDGGAVRDYSGNLVTQLSGTDRFLTGLGFRPKEVSDLQQAVAAQKRMARIETRRQSRFLKEQAEALIAGDVATVREMMAQRAQEDPTFDAKDTARKISAKAVDMTFPREVGRGVNVRAANEIAAVTGGRQGPRSSEMDRLFAKANFERALGIPGTGAPTSNRIQSAMEIDFLLEQNPSLTVDQAKLILRQREAVQRFDGSSLLF